jgi:hypothetical protein
MVVTFVEVVFRTGPEGGLWEAMVFHVLTWVGYMVMVPVIIYVLYIFCIFIVLNLKQVKIWLYSMILKEVS